MDSLSQFNKLKQWLNIKDNIKLFNRPQRGIYSTNDIKKNQIIIKIKSKYLLEYNTIYKLYPIDNIAERNSLVAFYILKLYLEKDSWWFPYIESFPENIDEYLYYWSNNQLKFLNNTSVMANGFYNHYSHIESMDNDWSIIYDYIEANEIFDKKYTYDYLYDLFIKFRILVGSRIFGYEKYDIDESGMIPYIDMINHSFNSNTTWYFDNNTNCFILQAVNDIMRGIEIVDDYGDKSNVNLLLFYGFTLSDNPYPVLRININKLLNDTNSDNLEQTYESDQTYETDQTYELSLNFDLTEIINKINIDKLNTKLDEIKKHHTIFLDKITDSNILNIYLDELKIVKILEKKLRSQ